MHFVVCRDTCVEEAYVITGQELRENPSLLEDAIAGPFTDQSKARWLAAQFNKITFDPGMTFPENLTTLTYAG